MFLALFSMMAFVLTTKLWKWYDSIINVFSSKIRILDIFTWGLLLWFVLVQYKGKALAFPRMSAWTSSLVQGSEGLEGLLSSLPQYCNMYTWCGLTVIGFMIIGFLRLFIKTNLFNK